MAENDGLSKAFDYVKTFYNELSQMISDLDELMGPDWQPLGGTRCTDGVSGSLLSPDEWLTYYVYRNYGNEKYKDLMKGILVIFDITSFPKSIIFGNANITPVSENKVWMWRLWDDNRNKLKELNGMPVELNAEAGGSIITGKLMSIPLDSINSKENLKDKIVQELLQLE